MRLLAPLVSVLAIIGLLSSGIAGAVTLEQYFFGFSDRDRGVYITGVLDLFAADSSRDPEYRQCVSELGPAGMHEAVSAIVRDDPRLLSFDAALWILYEASRRCNTSADASPAPDPRSLLPAADEPPAQSAGVPDLAGAPDERTEPVGIEPAEDIEPAETNVPVYRDWRYLAPGVLLLMLAGALVAMGVGRFRRHGPQAKMADDDHRPARRPTSSSQNG